MPLEMPQSTAKISMVGMPVSVNATSTTQPTMPSAAPIDVQQSLRHPVGELHESEVGRGDGAAPHQDLQQVLLDGAVQAGGLVDAGHEDAGLSRDGVPEQVDAAEEQQGGDVDPAGEQAAQTAHADRRSATSAWLGIAAFVLSRSAIRPGPGGSTRRRRRRRTGAGRSAANPSSPSGASAAASAKPISGPIDQANCAVPTCLARSIDGACSAM